MAATCSGVRPARLRISTSAPRRISERHTSAWPSPAARCSGVSPARSRVLSIVSHVSIPVLTRSLGAPAVESRPVDARLLPRVPGVLRPPADPGVRYPHRSSPSPLPLPCSDAERCGSKSNAERCGSKSTNRTGETCALPCSSPASQPAGGQRAGSSSSSTCSICTLSSLVSRTRASAGRVLPTPEPDLWSGVVPRSGLCARSDAVLSLQDRYGSSSSSSSLDVSSSNVTPALRRASILTTSRCPAAAATCSIVRPIRSLSRRRATTSVSRMSRSSAIRPSRAIKRRSWSSIALRPWRASSCRGHATIHASRAGET